MSFFIPCLIMLAVCIIRRVCPFGNNTLLISDLNTQYSDYLTYYKTILRGENDLFYTFSKALGGDMVGLGAYYLFSPLNLILLFFPNRALPNGLTWLIILKLGLCGLSFCCFLAKTYKGRPYRLNLIFSAAYALTGYNTAYFFNLMWLDGVILAPLIALGINRLINDRKAASYILYLFLALAVNFYIGFMLCCFSAIYFFYRLLLAGEAEISGAAVFIVLKFILSGIVSAGLASFILIPVLCSLSEGRGGFMTEIIGGRSLYAALSVYASAIAASVLLYLKSGNKSRKKTVSGGAVLVLSALPVIFIIIASVNKYGFSENFRLIDVFPKLFTFSLSWNEIAYGLPNVFSGMLTLSLTVLFFFNRRLSLREKLITAAVLTLILISFHLKPLNLLWHGMKAPTWFPYRYSFIFSFFMLIAAYRCLSNITDGNDIRSFIGSFLIISALSLIVFREDYEFISLKSIYYGVFSVLVFYILLYLMKLPGVRASAAVSAVIILSFLDIGLNACSSVKRLQEASSSKFDEYSAYVREVGGIIERVKAEDGGFYRLEKTLQRTNNDALQFQYNGLSHFSSCDRLSVRSFLGRLGFRDNGNWAYYNNGSTITADSLLGVKYLLARENLYKPMYERLFEQGGIGCYKNPYFLPVGFAVNKEILSADLSMDNLFEIQNQMLESMAGAEFGPVFTRAVDYNVSYTNLNITPFGQGYKFTKALPENEAYITFTFKAAETDTLYVYMNADTALVQPAGIYINDEFYGNYFTYYRWDIAPLGQFREGETLTFKVKLITDFLVTDEVLFYYEDLSVLERYIGRLKESPLAVERLSSSHLRGIINVKGDDKYLLLTIPFERGWHITIDGVRTEAAEAFGALTAVQAAEGSHTFEMKYIPPGLFAGAGISCGFLLLCLTYILVGNYNKYRKGNNYPESV